ncbi:MAG: SRPBCC domain-containing protein [Bacteroidia bacterium]|nr:SRPBCC domain-containing protein [Bacteroidia bacterium]
METEIGIHASPEKIWSILMDVKKYPEWNPFVRSVTGKLEENQKIKVVVQPVGSKAMTFEPRVIRLNPNREFRWQGSLFIKGLFDGQHIFELTDLGRGKTIFSHREEFKGLLVSPILKRIHEGTLQGFEKMNQALKERAEALD